MEVLVPPSSPLMVKKINRWCFVQNYFIFSKAQGSFP